MCKQNDINRIVVGSVEEKHKKLDLN